MLKAFPLHELSDKDTHYHFCSALNWRALAVQLDRKKKQHSVRFGKEKHKAHYLHDLMMLTKEI
jgi:hypothetical protein